MEVKKEMIAEMKPDEQRDVHRWRRSGVGSESVIDQEDRGVSSSLFRSCHSGNVLLTSWPVCIMDTRTRTLSLKRFYGASLTCGPSCFTS